ncbi:MAG: hypothetical protein KC897_01070 [Candidatus Omnitrophica bacterium]|nr:hypothetical protein [Candidatus Omnitrophota bacterium]MCB9720141.1 hypothetical protein [Candidatus Omnitrophota bacterium]
MSFNLHITRADHWSENRGREISREEWKACVAKDPDLAAFPEMGEGFYRWTGPGRQASAGEAWLGYREGNIYTTYPDKDLYLKMLSLARDLRARLQGDDGEIYVQPDEYPGADMRPAADTPPEKIPFVRKYRNAHWIEVVIIFIVFLLMFIWRMWG